MYKQQVIDLWQACFGDTESFVRLYFSSKYSDENTVMHIESGRLLSALQMLPYPMTCWGRELRTSYISGASTYPDARGRGLMKSLLIKAFAIMRSRDIHLSALIPAEKWLFDFYRKAGYATIFYSDTKSFSGVQPATVRQYDYTDGELFAYFTLRMRERPCCIQHNFDDFQIILSDLNFSGGRVITVSDSRNFIRGLALVVPDSGKVWIKEWFFDDDEYCEMLLGQIKALYPQYEIVAVTPSRKRGHTPFGMIRVIDAGMNLQYYAAAHPDLIWTLKLTDNQIPSNTGIYTLKEGYCIKQPPCYENIDDDLLPSELAEKLFLGESDPVPSISLMLN